MGSTGGGEVRQVVGVYCVIIVVVGLISYGWGFVGIVVIRRERGVQSSRVFWLRLVRGDVSVIFLQGFEVWDVYVGLVRFFQGLFVFYQNRVYFRFFSEIREENIGIVCIFFALRDLDIDQFM